MIHAITATTEATNQALQGFRPKYRLERAEPGDCLAFRRNALRYCFNAEDERMHVAHALQRKGAITITEYAIRLAESAGRRAKYRDMLRRHLAVDQMQELSEELNYE